MSRLSRVKNLEIKLRPDELEDKRFIILSIVGRDGEDLPPVGLVSMLRTNRNRHFPNDGEDFEDFVERAKELIIAAEEDRAIYMIKYLYEDDLNE